jgi:hypothetical protein
MQSWAVDAPGKFSNAGRLDDRFPSRHNSRMKPIVCLLGLFCVLFNSGCTYALWQTDNFRHFRYPSPDPKLVVLHDTQRDDFIACYDELSDKRGTVQRRAYSLRQHPDVGERGVSPKFLATIPANLPSIPVNPPTLSRPYVTETNSVFTIHMPDETIGPSRLPTYLESSGVPIQLALTPLTVAADAAIVGIVVGVLCPECWVDVASH